MKELTHFDAAGRAVMADVSGKEATCRTACAQGDLFASPAVIQAVEAGRVGKGDVLGVARVAGIMAAKRTWELIPLCHPLSLDQCGVDFALSPETGSIRAFCTVKTRGPTGVEMEALTGVSAALLTIYDMCKALDKRMRLEGIHLVRKQGGKSGDFFYCQEGEE